MGKIKFRSIANHKINGLRARFIYVNFDNVMQHSKFNKYMCVWKWISVYLNMCSVS